MNRVNSDIGCGRRAVLEALRCGRPCQRVLLARGSHGQVVDEIFDLLRRGRIPHDVTDRDHLERVAGPRHQGVVAVLAPRAYADYEQLLGALDPAAAFLVYLDSIQDPHNVGAILRTAHAVGADALVIQERNASGLTPAAVKAAAGAAEYLPVCRVTNLVRALEQAQSVGIWILGLDMDGESDFTAVDWRGPCALVVGSEGDGLRRLVRRTCDRIVRIPMARAQVGSFNASVAAALALYEAFRQRNEPSP